MRLIYAKKMQIPSGSANILQTMNMAWAFRNAGSEVVLFPMFRGSREEFRGQVKSHYHLAYDLDPDCRVFPLRNKGLYSLWFAAMMAAEWIRGSRKVFLARDPREGAVLAGLKRRVRRDHVLVYEIHESACLTSRDAGRGDWEAKMRTEGEVLRAADLIIYTGSHLRDVIRELYAPQTPGHVVPPGHNAGIFSPVPARDAVEPPFELAYFGTLHSGKGVDVFLEALAVLPDHFTGLVVGGNPASQLQAYRDLARSLGLAQRVRFTGQVLPAGIPEALGRSDAIVIPFQNASTFLSPIKLYEAMALGLPIIVTPMPALAELSRDHPSLVVAGGTDPQALARCITDTFAGPDGIRNLRRQARSRESSWSWDDRARRILELVATI